MILYPAVDIKDGKCVRLTQGRKDEVTVFGDDPTAMAKHWLSEGAKALHVIDLDGAFDGMPRNMELVTAICAECAKVDVPVQLGGGVRDLDIARNYVQAGVSRLIIGTLALENPEAFAAMAKALPGQVGVSLDAVDGKLKTRGWVEDAGLMVDDVLPRLAEQGAAFVIYTDISRDGMQTGPNAAAMERLLSLTDLPVLAAGGVSTLDDVKVLAGLGTKGLSGIITGKAIYAGTLDFAEGQAYLDSRTAEEV